VILYGSSHGLVVRSRQIGDLQLLGNYGALAMPPAMQAGGGFWRPLSTLLDGWPPYQIEARFFNCQFAEGLPLLQELLP